MLRCKKIIFLLSIIAATGLCCTGYQGLTKDDFEKNPRSYSMISDGHCISCANTGINEIDDTVFITANTVVVTPGQHKIKIGIVPYSDPTFSTTFTLYCRAGFKYYLDAEYNSDTQSAVVTVREEPITDD